MPTVNPFKPNSPVPTGMFAGRYDELLELEKGLFQTKSNCCTNFLITGERGIGKSSLLTYLKHSATGSIASISHGSFNFVTLSVNISEKTTLSVFIRLLEQCIRREIGKSEKLRSFLGTTWEFVQRLKIMDSGIDQAEMESEIDLIVDNFAYSLSETCKRLKEKKNEEDTKEGLVFLIDEADNAAPELHIGYFFKAVTELLQRYDCDNVMFVIAGLPDILEKLASSHESSLRVFNHRTIKSLNVDDRHYVIEKAMEEGNKINIEQTTISNEAKDLISTLSEGYPHFIQQLGYSAYDHNNNGEITKEDVLSGAFKDGGAIDAIGHRYYASPFYEKIKSDEYREVLSIMADKLSAWVKKSEIRDKFNGDDSTLTNALKALTQRKIILKNPSKVGEYRLQHRGFALWIKLFGHRKR